MPPFRKGLLAITGAALIGLAIAAVVISQSRKNPEEAEQAAVRPAALLLADILAYRREVASLDPQTAAARWFELYDRAAQLDQDDYDTLDYAVYGPVGTRSMLASLPPPEAWPAFRTLATQKKILPVRYVAEILSADIAAARASLSEIENDQNRAFVASARASLAKLYGTADERVAEFTAALETNFAGGALPVPDLVAIVGETRAAELLSKAVTGPSRLNFEGGEATRALARRLALENINRMQVPQWALAQGMQGAALFEAIDRRFKSTAFAANEWNREWARREALTYYFLASVRDGRQAQAEAALVKLDDEGSIEIPRDAVDALQRANLNEPLFRFLDAQLSRRPEIAAWDLYIAQAAFTGHSADALALIQRQFARKNLTDADRIDFQIRYADALLAADKVAEATAEFRELLAKPPVAGENRLQERIDAAIQAAGVGRLTGDKALASGGIDFAKAAVELPLDAETDRSRSPAEAKSALYAELRKQGRAEEALQLALATVERKPSGFSEALTRRLGVVSNDDRRAMLEIAGIYSSTGRHADVIALTANSPRWGAEDLAELLKEVDSQDEPLGAIVAKALDATGDKASALRVARATVAVLPGDDSGYEIVAALDPDAARVFDELFAVDEYEERPLIWKASVQLAAGSTEEAEATIRRAIAIDPSDGEEGPNDRMRAYAVLAEILRKKGSVKDASLYASAVEAIRLSEHGDDFYAKGLYQRAFKTYKEALEKFSDAYCIQSRLAVQLMRQGRRQEALQHYRRAYELMPTSFGRVESHCFGCESVFQGAEAQSIAEQVFIDIVRKSPEQPQAHYLLAYLREQQGRYAEAVRPLRAAVSLDPHYLNAWKRLHAIAGKTYLESGELDIARLKLLELDPLQRHGYYGLEEVGQLAALWNGAVRAQTIAGKVDPPKTGVYPLKASAALRAEAAKGDSQRAREMQEMQAMEEGLYAMPGRKSPSMMLYENVLIANARMLMGGDEDDYVD